MDLSTCYCRYRLCHRYGQSGSKARLESAGWHERARRLKCLECGHRFSSRAGTAYVGIRTPEETYRKGVHHLAEGVSIRATARLMECDKDTVCHWLPRVGRHCRRVREYFFRHVPLTECQLDELWTFVYKKEKQLTWRSWRGVMAMRGFGPPSIPFTNWFRHGEWVSGRGVTPRSS